MSRRVSTRAEITDPLYVFDNEAQAYVALDADRHAAIQNGAMRF